jgi:hypothetical protein
MQAEVLAPKATADLNDRLRSNHHGVAWPSVHVIADNIRKDVDGRPSAGHDGGGGGRSTIVTLATTRIASCKILPSVFMHHKMRKQVRAPSKSGTLKGETTMADHQGAAHHKQAAHHHEAAAKHHHEAAKHHEAGEHETAAHHAHAAEGHAAHAETHSAEAAKHHAAAHAA